MFPRRRFRLTPLAVALGAAMGFPAASIGQQIVIDGKTATTLSTVGTVTDVRTTTRVGDNAFNSFSKFDVFAGNTVNLHVPDGANNLLNLVNSASASRIDGMLNAIKSGRIGGNVFLANPEGIIVGASGVINVGSLTLLTPTHAWIDGFFDAPGSPNAAALTQVAERTVPINASGLIRVQGRINTVGDAVLQGGLVNVEGVIQSGALFTNTQVDFSDVVNTTDIQTGNAVIVENGRIQIVATGDVAITGTVATNGGADVKAGRMEVRAGGNLQLGAGALLAANGQGENSSGGTIKVRAAGNLGIASGAGVHADGGSVSGDGGAIVISAGGTMTLSGGDFTAAAPNGVAGSILIAPTELRIEEDLLRAGGGNGGTSGNGITWDAGSIALQADESIIVAENRTISTRMVTVGGGQSALDAHLHNASTGDSGDITLSAKHITLESGSRLLADATGGFQAGDISLIAEDKAEKLFFKATEHQDASIDVHGAILKGRNVTLKADANDVFEYTGNDVADVFLRQLDNLGYIADVSISKAVARVTVDGGSTLTATEILDINANAKADAAMRVSGELGFGFGYGSATASATAEVLDAALAGGAEVKVKADSNAKTDVSVATINRERDKNPLPVDASQYIDFALAIGEGDLDSLAVIGAASTVSSNGTVTVNARGTKNASVSAKGGAYDDGTAGAGVAFSSFDSDVTARLDGDVTRATGVVVSAELDSPSNSIGAASGSGSGALAKVKQFFPSELLSTVLSTTVSKVLDAVGVEKPASPTSAEKFGLAASFLSLDQSNDVSARIGPQARIVTTGAVDVLATSTDLVTYRASSSVDQAKVNNGTTTSSNAKKVALSAAIALADLDNHTEAYIGDGAIVDAGGAITVSAHSDIPVPYSAWGDWSDVDDFLSGMNKLETLLGSATFSLITGWTQSFAESEKLGLAGSFNFFSLDNTADAWIGDGARINTGGGTMGAGRDVTVAALAEQGTINLGGVFGFKLAGVDSKATGIGGALALMDFSAGAHASIGRGAIIQGNDILVDARTESDNITIAEAGGKSATGTAFNASVALVDVRNETIASVDGSAVVSATGGLNIRAVDESRTITAAGGFSKGATAIGLAASINDIERVTRAGAFPSTALAPTLLSVQGLQSGSNNKLVLVPGSTATAGQAMVFDAASGSGITGLTDGALYYVIVPDPAHPDVIQLAASPVDAANGTAIANLGPAHGPALTLSSVGALGAAGAISASARNEGVLNAVAVAGSYTSDGKEPAKVSGESASARLDKLAAYGNKAEARYGVSFSGDAAVNEITDVTEARLEGVRIDAAASLQVAASNDTDVLSIGGSAAVSTNKGKEPGIAGSYGQTTISNDTVALIRNSDVDVTGAVDVAAESGGEIMSFNIGIAVATKNSSVAGSVSINKIANETYAYVDQQSTVEGASASVRATDDSSIFALAGTGNFSGQDGSGMGASVALNEIANKTDAHVAQSDVTATAGGVSVGQESSQDIKSIAVSIGVSTKLAANFAVSLNSIESTETAYVSGKAANGIEARDGISVVSTDHSTILGVGGGVAISRNSGGAGGSGGYSLIDNDVSAYLSGTEVESTTGGVTVSAKSDQDIETIGIGFAGGQSTGLAGSVAVNRIDTTTDAYITGSTVKADDSVAVVADADFDFETYGGALGIGLNSVGVGGAVAVNLLYGDTHAYIAGGSIVDAAGNGIVAVPTLDLPGPATRDARGVAVAARTLQRTDTWAVAGGFSSGIGAGLTGVGNEATGETFAWIGGGSKINTNTGSDPASPTQTLAAAGQGVSVEAFSRIDYDTQIGSLGLGLNGAGFSATVGVSLIKNQTRAYVDNAALKARDGIRVATYSAESVDGEGVSFGAGGGLGLAGTVFATSINGLNEAFIRNTAQVDAGGGITVKARDQVFLVPSGDDNVDGDGAGDIGLGILGAMGSASATAAFGAAVSTLSIGNTTRAYISDAKTNAGGTTLVDASATQSAQLALAGVALATWVGAGGSVVVNSISTTTEAFIGETVAGETSTNAGRTGAAQDVTVSASNTTTIDTAMITATGGFAGVGASVDATSVRNDVSASIGAGVQVSAGRHVDVGATSNTDIDSLVVAGGGGVVGVQGAVAVVSVGAGTTSGDVANTQQTANQQSQDANAWMGLSGTPGDYAVDAMFRSDAAPGGTSSFIGDAASVTAGGAIGVHAQDQISIDLKQGAGVVGGLGLGASVGVATLKPTVRAFVGEDSRLSAGGAVTISAEAKIVDSSVKAYVGGIGGVALIQAVATLDSEATVEAYLGDSAKVSKGGTVTVSATRSSEQEAEAWGLSAAATGAYGGSVARSSSSGNTTALVGDDVDLAAAGALAVTASNRYTGNFSNAAKAVAGAGGGLVGASGALATAQSSGNVTAATGSRVKLPSGDVIVAAGRESLQQADSLGVTAGGFLAVGVTIANAESSGTTRAELGADAQTKSDREGSLLVAALATDANHSESVAGSGGALAGNGAEANTDDNSQVFAGIAARAAGGTIHGGAVTLQAIHASEYAGHANSVNAAIVGASGAFVDNDLRSKATVQIGAGVDIDARQGISTVARNAFYSTLSGESASGAAGGVVVGSAAMSRTSIDSTTAVRLGNGVDLESGTDAVLNPGGITLEASTLIAATDRIVLTTGGAIAGAGTDSAISAKVANSVAIGADAELDSQGGIAAGAYTQAGLSSTSLVNTWGLAGVGIAHARTTIDVTEDVSVGDGAILTGFGNVNLTAGDDPKGIYDGSISANAYAESYVRGLIALPYAYADSDVSSRTTLAIGAGAKVRSAQNVILGAYNGDITATAHGAGHGYQLGFIPTDTGNKGNSSPQPVNTSRVTFGANSEAVAGFYHTLDITIPDCAFGAATCAINAAPGGAPFLSAYTPQFDVQAFIDDNFSGPGKALIKTGTSSTPVGAVALGTLFAAGGTVTVNADTLQGSGTITAYGGPSITVNNESPNYLVLGNVLIPNTPGGRVQFTGAAVAEDAAAAGITVSEVRKDQPGTITIRNSHAGPVGSSNFGPALFLTGDIQNIGGVVNVTNDFGSLGQIATIFGKEVNVRVPEGVAVIDLPEPRAYYAGGNPYSEWMNAVFWPGGNPATAGRPNANQAFTDMFGTGTGFGRPGNEIHYFIYGNCVGGDCFGTEVQPNATQTTVRFDYATADLSGSARSSAIYGGRVLIKARYIDINGGITIGADTDWSLNLTTDLLAPVGYNLFTGQYTGGEIALADFLFANNLVSNPIFDLKTATAGSGDSKVGVQYDAQNKVLLLNNVRASSDGGSLVLDGGIMSTNGLGSIHVNGGLGDVEVSNQTGRAMVVKDIYTGSAGPTQTVVSTVDITDSNYAAASNHWVYQYTPQDGLSVYNGAQGSSIEDGNMTLMPDTAVYRPLAGLRWQWQQVATMQNALPAVTTPGRTSLESWGNQLGCCNWTWDMPAGQPNDPWQYVTASGALSTTPEGRTVVASGQPVFTRTLTASITESYPFVQAGGSQNFFHSGTEFDNGLKTLFFPKEVTFTATSSVKADNPIAIDFSGSAVGRVSISSNAGVTLAGAITNPGGTTTITSTGGSVTQSANASLQSESLVISATTGIGTSLQPLVARLATDGTVTAAGGTDGVYLDLTGGRIASVTAKNVAGTQFGNVYIRSLDDLLPVTGGTGAIVGADITLVSTLGSLGSQADSLRLSAMGADGTSGVVEATALHDIVLSDSAAHDFLVGHVTSIADGDISISVPNGSILNARGQTSAEALSQDQVRQVWQDLRLTDAYGAEQEGSRTARSVVAFENMGMRYFRDYHEMVNGGDTSSQRYLDTVGWLDANVGGNWRTEPYETFTFHASDAQVADLTRNAVWTEAELSNSIKQAALRSGAGAPVGVGEANIVGHNVKLDAGNGIGTLADPIDVSMASIIAGTLDARQSAALSLARAAGDIVPLGTDAQGNFVTYELATHPDGSVDYTSVPAGITPYGFRIAQTAPLFVDAAGAVSANAGDALFIQSVRPTLTIDQVHAGGVASLVAPGSIVAAATRSDPLAPMIAAGSDLRLAAGTGSLGAQATPLTLQVGGKLVSGSAAQDAWLTSQGNLTVDSLFAGGRLVLDVENGGSLQAGIDGLNVRAHDAWLSAEGGIGSSQRALAMQLADTGVLTADAGGDLHVHGTTTLQVGAVTAGGSASLSADGSLLSAAGFNGVNVTAEDITLVSTTEDIGAASKYFVIEDRGITNAEALGNIYLEQRNRSFNADLLESTDGSVNLRVTTGDATIGKIIAPEAVDVRLASNGTLHIDDLDPATASLAVAGAGGSIEVVHAQVSQRLSASASNITLEAISQVGGRGPLHLVLQGAGGGIANVIDANVISANDVTIDRLAAQRAYIDADVSNLWIEDARIVSFAQFSNESFTATVDNVNRVRYDSDLQLYAPSSFYLRFFADPRFETNALAIDYGDDFTVNGMGSGNSVTKFIPRLLSMLGLRDDEDKVDEETPETGLVTWSSSALVPDDAITAIEQLEVNGK